MPSDIGLRHAVINAAQLLTRQGLNKGAAGNVSLRTGDGFLITPTGMPAETMAPGDLVFMDFDGQVRGTRAPSSEWRFHAEVLRHRPELGAVIHTHAPYCTTLAVLGRGIPPFHYMIAVAGGKDIRCAPYATFGTEALCRGVVAALEGRKACLMTQHGMIAAGRDIAEALKVTIEVEELARIYWQALQVGEPLLLDDAEMDRVLDKFRTYGQPQLRE